MTTEWWGSARSADALAAWRTLERRLGGLPLMCSADWTEIWLRHYGPSIPHRFVIGRSAEGQVVALLLLARGAEDRDGPFALRTWHLGTAGEPDADSVVVEYNAVACEPAYRDAFLADVLQGLLAESDWDELRCDGFAADDTPACLTPESGWLQLQKRARWTDLDRVRESGQELLKFLGDSTRKNIRQNLRDCGAVSVEVPRSTDEAHAFFDELMALHQQRWNSEGRPGCYASRVFSAFHRELIDRMSEDGRLLLIRVRAGNTTLGCTQYLIDRGRALNYQGGRQIGAQRLSPGLLTDYLGMQACLDRGYSAYDFLAGDSIHKQRLTTETTPLNWLTLRRPRWKFALMQQLRECRRWTTAWLGSRRSGAESRVADSPIAHLGRPLQ